MTILQSIEAPNVTWFAAPVTITSTSNAPTVTVVTFHYPALTMSSLLYVGPTVEFVENWVGPTPGGGSAEYVPCVLN